MYINKIMEKNIQTYILHYIVLYTSNSKHDVTVNTIINGRNRLVAVLFAASWLLFSLAGALAHSHMRKGMRICII